MTVKTEKLQDRIRTMREQANRCRDEAEELKWEITHLETKAAKLRIEADRLEHLLPMIMHADDPVAELERIEALRKAYADPRQIKFAV